MIKTKEDLLQVREAAKAELASYDCRILVCSGTGCIATGSAKIYDIFAELVKEISFISDEMGSNTEAANELKEESSVFVRL